MSTEAANGGAQHDAPDSPGGATALVVASTPAGIENDIRSSNHLVAQLDPGAPDQHAARKTTLTVNHTTAPRPEGDIAGLGVERFEISDALEHVYGELRNLAATELPPEAQDCLAELVDLRDALLLERMYGLLPSLEIAVLALTASPPNTKAVNSILSGVRKRLRAMSLIRLLRRNSPPANVTLGLLLLVFLLVSVLAVAVPRIPSEGMIAGLNGPMLVLVGVAGAFGSIVSIARRIAEFGRSVADSPVLLFFTGLFKPVVGVGFAVFLFTAMKSGILSLQPPAASESYFFAALGFLAGFSEKFAPDLVAKAEDAMGNPAHGVKDTMNVNLQSSQTAQTALAARRLHR